MPCQRLGRAKPMMRVPHGPAVAPSPPPDYGRLSAYLAALHYPLRLELLHQLRTPKLLGEIHVVPHRAHGGSPERPAARETVREHLDKLVEVGLVRVDTVEADGRSQNRYAVVPQKLYELTEEMRRLSTVYAGRGVGADVTGTLGDAAEVPAMTGPRLVLVHGLYEGKAFPLTEAAAHDGAWVLGRARGLAVCLDYDPFVSLENAAVARVDDRFEVSDLPQSKNGTSVNWALLPKGGSRALRSGDLIGVGRSLLLFLAD